MKLFGSRFLMVAGLAGTAGLFLNVNCGGGSSGGGTGGSTTGTGGTHTGGTTGTGGTGTGGTHTGGTTGTGGGAGASATGGTAGGSATGGTAGSSATGGAGGVKGTGGGGGSSNTDGGTQQFSAFSYTFDKDVQGWGLNNFASAGNLLNVDGGVKPTLSWDNSVGSTGSTPTGSLKLDATFSDYSQFAQAAVNIQPTVDATGKEVSVYVMLDAEDGGATWPGNVQVSASTGSTYNGYTQIIKSITTAGTWMKVELPLTGVASPFDPSQLIQIAVEFVTYSKPDGGTFGAPQHRTFHIDTVTDGSGNPAAPPLNVTFNTTLQGLSLSAASFQFPDGGVGPALTFDSTVGDPAGSAKLVVPFNAYNQQLDTQINLSPTVDLTGKTIHAKVMLDSGTWPSGYVQLHASGPDYNHYAAASGAGSINATTLGSAKWVDLTMDLSAVTVTGFDVTKILQVGVQFGTGAGPDGGVFPTTGEPLTFHIDSIVAE